MENKIIRLLDPLPCGTWDGVQDRECGNDAYVAHAYRVVAPGDVPHGGWRWGVLPVCKDCAEKAAALYDRSSGTDEPRTETIRFRASSDEADALKQAADRQGMTVSEYIRLRIGQ